MDLRMSGRRQVYSEDVTYDGHVPDEPTRKSSNKKHLFEGWTTLICTLGVGYCKDRKILMSKYCSTQLPVTWKGM